VDDLLRATARAEERHFWFRGFRWFVRPVVHHALTHNRSPRALDCGCGTGTNLHLLTPYGAAYGFDLSTVGLQIGRQRGAAGLVRASVAAVPFASGAFDLVTSFDVLYALDEPTARTAVAEMFRVARPGGYALVNVAAMDILRGDHSVLSQEKRRYTKSALRWLMTDAGFRVERITHTNSTLFPFLLVGRTLHRLRGLAPETDAAREITVPREPINAALSALLFLESVWLRWFNNPAGSSLLCLARKPEDAVPR
jgi:SAM-dependent methyltransferase